MRYKVSEATMRATIIKKIQVTIIILFAVLSFSDSLAQVNCDLRQRLYPPYLQHQLFRPTFSLHENQSAQNDSIVTFLGRWAWGECFAVASKDRFVYVGNGSMLQIFDAFDPSPSKIIAELLMDGLIVDIQIAGKLAYVLSSDLVIFDLATPSRPQQLGKVKLSHGPTRFYMAGNYCYVISFDTMFIIDVIRSDRPTLVASIPAGGENPTDVIAIGDYVYIGHRAYLSFMIVDVSDPADPKWVDAYSGIGTPNTFTLFGNYLLVGGLSFRILDASQPTTPIQVASLPIRKWITGIAVNDSCAFVGVADSGLIIIDISQLDAPKPIGFIERKGIDFSSRALTLVSNYAYVAWHTGLWIVDISDKAKPQEKQFFPTGHVALDVAVDGKYLYVAHALGGLWILDISEPSSPQPVSHFDTNGLTSQIKVRKNIAYLFNRPDISRPKDISGLSIIDVSNPSSPKFLSHHQGFVHAILTSGQNHFAVTDSFVFLTQPDSGLEIIDIVNPRTPRVVGLFQQSRVEGVAVANGYAYLGTWENGMRVLDVKNPSQPREVGSFQRPNVPVFRLQIAGGIAYLDEAGAIRILDVSNPSEPQELSYLPFGIGDFDFEVYGQHLHIPGIVVDVSSPRAPQIICRYSSPGGSITTDGKNIFGAGRGGVHVWRNDLTTEVTENNSEIFRPDDFTLLPNFPNPFKTTTEITFFLQKDALVNLEIFNVLGQRVWRLSNEMHERGKYVMLFDGGGLPNGIYFGRLQVERNIRQIKMLLVR